MQETMKVYVGSKNPVKISSSQKVFGTYFRDVEVRGFDTNSEVSDQPIGDETWQGAENRALKLYGLHDSDFCVGIEGGITKLYGRWFCFGCICVVDSYGQRGYGTTGLFELPEPMLSQLMERKELGEIIDEFTGKENTKHKGGAVGYFTREILGRESYYVNGLTLALIPLLNKKTFFPGKNESNSFI